jgi:hypothetical protein
MAFFSLAYNVTIDQSSCALAEQEEASIAVPQEPDRGGVCYLVNGDLVDRGIMPSSNYVWGISYYLLYACVAVIALGASWMFAAKREMKKEAKIVPA